MNPFEMVVLIVVIVTVGRVIMNRNEKKYGKNKDGSPINPDEYCTKSSIAPYLEKIEALEERIKVLERIATDKSRSLSDEINNLK